MSRMEVMLVGMIALALTLAACGPGTDTPEPPEGAELPGDVETAVKEALSARMGIATEEIEVVAAEQREWPDACLGLPEEGEVCAQVITPGWEVTARAEGEEYVLRTDQEGSVVRMEE